MPKYYPFYCHNCQIPGGFWHHNKNSVCPECGESVSTSAWIEKEKSEMREFPSGATRDTDAGKIDYDCLSADVLVRYGQYMHEKRDTPDGTRSADNWKAGMDKWDVYWKSLQRHLMEVKYHSEPKWAVLEGEKHEFQDHLCAIIFNAMGMLYEDLNGR